METKAKNLNGETPHPRNHVSAGEQARPVGRSPGAFAFSAPFGPRIMFEAEGGSGGGAGAGGAGGDAGADDGAGGGSDGAAEKPARPDYIPENFWDADKGFKTDDFNGLVAFKAEHDANLAQVPEKPDLYEVKLPKDFKLPDGVELPEGQESPINADDPRISHLREFAHANQMSQSQFEGMIALGAQMDIAERASIDAALAEQAEKLGAKGKERVSAITTWLGAKIGGELAEAVAPMIFTAKQVEAFEAMMRLNRGAVSGNPGSGRDSGKTQLSDEEYEKMSPTEKINYARQHSKK